MCFHLVEGEYLTGLIVMRDIEYFVTGVELTV